MEKKTSWLGWVKKLFSCSEKTKRGNKDLKWKLGRFEASQYPELVETRTRKTLCEATEEQRKHAMDVAVAATAAAQAAVAAAEAAAKVVRLTTASEFRRNFRKLDPRSAAIKIQSTYRAHLARKALRALKGIVRLQAIVRGRAVRRKMNLTLKCTPSDSRNKSEARWRSSSQARHQFSNDHENMTLSEPTKKVQEKEQKLESGSQGAWISVLSKEDVDMVWLRKQEATTKRERMKKYSSSYRERVNGNITLQDLLSKKEHGARSCRAAEPREGREASKRTSPSKRQSKEKTTEFTLARNSFSHEKWDPFMIPISPDFPAYMASTESAKAKTRSMSIPKQRVGFWDNCLDTNYLQNKNRLSLWSSSDGDSLWRY